MQTPNFDNEIVKFIGQIAWMQTVTTFPTLFCEILDVGTITNVRFNKKVFLLNISGVVKLTLSSFNKHTLFLMHLIHE